MVTQYDLKNHGYAIKVFKTHHYKPDEVRCHWQADVGV